MGNKKFQKESANRDILQISTKKICVDNIQSITNETTSIKNSVTSRAYSKESLQKNFNLIILILEDAKETKSYFSCITNKNINTIKIKTITDNKEGIKPNKMADLASETEEKYGLVYSEGDCLYMICDLDDYRNHLQKLHLLIKTSIDTKRYWQLIISNPCIEIWFYYHHTDKKPLISSRPPEKYSQAMKEAYRNIKVQTKVYTPSLLKMKDLSIPIANSKKVFELEDNGFIPQRYSTQMYIVGEKLLQVIKQHLEETRKEEAKRKMQFIEHK